MEDNAKILLNLLQSVLGDGKSTSKGNHSFKCPFCNHHKLKLEIQLHTNENKENPWNCWICHAKGKTIKTLFKKIGVETSKMSELRLIISPGSKIVYTDTKIQLPQEFISLVSMNDLDKRDLILAKHAIKFLKSRGVSKEDIIKYNIGFCTKGKYSDRVIIPSYDEKGIINYFTARTWDEEIQPHYKNPSVSRNIIGFEYFINWNLPIVLCEGPLDAIAIKRNVIPLFGKTIPEVLMKKIVTSQVTKVYIALDKDALKDALKFSQILMDYGKQVYLVDLNDKDPSKLGFKEFTKIIQNTYPITFSKLFELKLEI
jgi:DNA primase